MCGHAERQVGERPERREIGGVEFLASRFNHRQSLVAVHRRPAVAGQMLQHRQHAAIHQPRGDRAGKRGHLVGRIAIGTVTDDCVGAGHRHIGERQTVDIDADVEEIAGDQPAAQSRGRKPDCVIPFVQAAVHRAGRIGRPMRRAEPLHAATLLIDQHRRMGRHRSAKRIH